MLRVRIDPKAMIQVVITASFIGNEEMKSIESLPDVEDYMRKLEIEFGGKPNTGQEVSTPLEQVTAFSHMFADFLCASNIESSAHQLLVFEDRFVGVLTVSAEDAEKIADWYESLRKQDDEAE